MTTAPENRGGYRPTAPQNNPANVSATGGNGQSGRATQPAKYIAGMPYGEGQATMAQQMGAPMQGTERIGTSPLEITPLTAETKFRDEPITAGVDFGAGPDSSILNLPQQQERNILSVIRQIAQQDPTGETELIYRMLEDSGA
jgi:hypothetical protein